MVCNLVLPHVTRMVIDEEKRFILTNYEQAKKGGKASNTNHATEYLDLRLKVITEKPNRVEVWNFKIRRLNIISRLKNLKQMNFLSNNTIQFSSIYG